MPKSYGHFCGLAESLQVMGERWTALVLRELMFGGRRFSDILAGLPGINSTLLSGRLKDLETNGIVARRTLPAPAASVVYELTEDGHELAQALVPLAKWGARRLVTGRRGQHFRSRWLLLSLHACFNAEAASHVTETYELRVGDETFALEVRNGTLRTEQVLSLSAPALSIAGDVDTILDLGLGRLPVADALAGGKLTFGGDPAAAQRFMEIFPLEKLVPKATALAAGAKRARSRGH